MVHIFPADISQDDEFKKEETIRKGIVRRSARTAQKNAQNAKINDSEVLSQKSKIILIFSYHAGLN